MCNKEMNSFYSKTELEGLGLKSIGKQVLISRKCSIYGPEKIEIGDNVRIDDFCILSGNIKIGSNVHISAYVALYGSLGIELENYTGISPRSTIYSAMDDFSGNYLIGPVHNENKINVTGGKVILRQFSQIGCNSVIFPALTIGEGSIIGAMSLVKRSVPDWEIWAGDPVKFIKNRARNLLKL